MTSWLRRPDGLVAWLVLLVAVFNFTGALFSSESVTEEALWTKVLKDLPILALLVVLALHVRRDPAGRARVALVREALSPRRVPRGLLRGASTYEMLAALLVLAALMAVLMVFSGLVVDPPSLGVLVSARYYVIYPLLSVAIAVAGPLRLRPLAIGVVALGCLQTGVAILEYFETFGRSYYFGLVEFAGYLYPRAIGTLGNPNNLGIFLSLGIFLVLSAGPWRWRWRSAALVVLGVGLLLSVSRTAPLALVVALGIVGVRPGRGRIALGVAGAVAVVLVVALSSGARLGTDPSTAGSFGNRGDTAANALRIWTEGPRSFLVGRGFDAQTSVGADGTVAETVIDNMILAIAVEGGLVALLLLAGIAALGVRMAYLASPRSSLGTVGRRYAWFLLVYTPLAVNFRLFPGALFFWVIVGSCAGAALAQASGTTGSQSASRPPRVVMDPLPH
jgi:hypothetical protein